METRLNCIASESLARLAHAPVPARGPQLLAADGGFALLRGQEGVFRVQMDELPDGVDLAPIIDHTLLKADADQASHDRLFLEAKEWGFASVCVNSAWVGRAATALAGTVVRVCTVVGFPLGASTASTKAFEAREAIQLGATEVDMVLAIGAAKGGDWDAVARDLEAVRQATEGKILKVILETCLLSEVEKVRACELSAQAGCDFVKTSTGFSSGGATVEDIRLMRDVVGTRCGVKASGGVRDREAALAMIRAGATRLGLSSSVAVVTGGTGSGAY